MFLIKFYEIGHFRPNYRTFIFELFLTKKNILHKKTTGLVDLSAGVAYDRLSKCSAKTYVFEKI